MGVLTERRKKVLEFIREYVEVHGYPPSIREIASHLGVSGTLGVVKHLKALERGGYIRRVPRKLPGDLPHRFGSDPLHPHRGDRSGRRAATCHRGNPRVFLH